MHAAQHKGLCQRNHVLVSFRDNVRMEIIFLTDDSLDFSAGRFWDGAFGYDPYVVKADPDLIFGFIF